MSGASGNVQPLNPNQGVGDPPQKTSFTKRTPGKSAMAARIISQSVANGPKR